MDSRFILRTKVNCFNFKRNITRKVSITTVKIHTHTYIRRDKSTSIWERKGIRIVRQTWPINSGALSLDACAPGSRKSFARQVFRDMYFHAREPFYIKWFSYPDAWLFCINGENFCKDSRRGYIHLQSRIQIMGFKALRRIRHFRLSWIIKLRNCEQSSDTRAKRISDASH